MASLLSHAVAAFSIGKAFEKKKYCKDPYGKFKLLLIGMVCSMLPDADVVGFKFHVAYSSVFGHRGITHSLLFALLLALLVTVLFFRKEKLFSKDWMRIFIYFFIATVSHPILDALTNGGLGVAFFAPFDNTRYFFPFHPIQVSPIKAGAFFGEKGIAVIKSEFVWIWIPSVVFIVVNLAVRKFLTKRKQSHRK